jgi:hypothetical protein
MVKSSFNVIVILWLVLGLYYVFMFKCTYFLFNKVFLVLNCLMISYWKKLWDRFLYLWFSCLTSAGITGVHVQPRNIHNNPRQVPLHLSKPHTCRSSESPLRIACCRSLFFTKLGLRSGSLTWAESNSCLCSWSQSETR